MKVLVSDSSILIEFAKRELLGKMFDLEFEFAVPDLLFHEELIDLGPYARQDLLEYGLRVEPLDAEGLQSANAYQVERPALSLVDSFALALADLQDWQLLTEDRTMRNVAESKGIVCLGALWIFDRMLDACILPTSQARVALDSMYDDPRCPVAKDELVVRIRRLDV